MGMLVCRDIHQVAETVCGVGGARFLFLVLWVVNIHLVELGEIWGNNGEWRFYCWVLVFCRRSYCCFDAAERKFDSLYL